MRTIHTKSTRITIASAFSSLQLHASTLSDVSSDFHEQMTQDTTGAAVVCTAVCTMNGALS
jgi:hypothetical protein